MNNTNDLFFILFSKILMETALIVNQKCDSEYSKTCFIKIYGSLSNEVYYLFKTIYLFIIELQYNFRSNTKKYDISL